MAKRELPGGYELDDDPRRAKLGFGGPSAPYPLMERTSIEQLD